MARERPRIRIANNWVTDLSVWSRRITQEIWQAAVHSGTKLAAIIDAMHNPSGASIASIASIAQMMDSTGWQSHTVRGAISGIVKK